MFVFPRCLPILPYIESFNRILYAKFALHFQQNIVTARESHIGVSLNARGSYFNIVPSA